MAKVTIHRESFASELMMLNNADTMNHSFDRRLRRKGKEAALAFIKNKGPHHTSNNPKPKKYKLFPLNGMMEEVDGSGNFINV